MNYENDTLNEWRRQEARDEFPKWKQGSLEQRYKIYLDCTDEENPKSFDEWLNPESMNSAKINYLI